MSEAKKVTKKNKQMRSTHEHNQQILWEWVLLWKRLFHKNIAPFHGVNMTHTPLSLVYDWGENGNIIQYITSHPEVSRLSLVCPLLLPYCQLGTLTNFICIAPDEQLVEVAKGLEYLHSLSIPHGRLKGVSSLSDSCSIPISFLSVFNCVIVLILW